MRGLLRVAIAGALFGIAFMVSAAPAHTQASPGGELTLPLRLSAFAVTTGGTLRTTAVWDIRITRWTTPDERSQLLGEVVESDTNNLLKALLKLPDHGRVNVPGHRGPDPHKVVRRSVTLAASKLVRSSRVRTTVRPSFTIRPV